MATPRQHYAKTLTLQTFVYAAIIIICRRTVTALTLRRTFISRTLPQVHAMPDYILFYMYIITVFGFQRGERAHFAHYHYYHYAIIFIIIRLKTHYALLPFIDSYCYSAKF